MSKGTTLENDDDDNIIHQQYYVHSYRHICAELIQQLNVWDRHIRERCVVGKNIRSIVVSIITKPSISRLCSVDLV